MDEVPLLSRAPAEDRRVVEIRPLVPVEVVAVLDAVCCNEGGKDRTKKLNEILLAWAKAEAHKATVVVRCLEGNPSLMDSQSSGFGRL